MANGQCSHDSPFGSLFNNLMGPGFGYVEETYDEDTHDPFAGAPDLAEVITIERLYAEEPDVSVTMCDYDRNDNLVCWELR